MIALAQCTVCSGILQKHYVDLQEKDIPRVAPDISRLVTVLEVREEPHRNTRSTTRLFKCPRCGTYYYCNRYRDAGEHFLDPVSDALTIRRYTFRAAINLLSGCNLMGGVNLPPSVDQMTRWFVEGAATNIVTLEDSEQARLSVIAEKEMGLLETRIPEVLAQLMALTHSTTAHAHLKLHAVESLLEHFLVEHAWARIDVDLLGHPDIAMAAESARILVGLGTDDAPLLDLVHVPPETRRYAATIMKDPTRRKRICEVLLAAAQDRTTRVLNFDYCYGNSSYFTMPLSLMALSALTSARMPLPLVQENLDLLVGLLDESEQLWDPVCGLLRDRAEKSRKAASLIRRRLKQEPLDEQLTLSRHYLAIMATQRRKPSARRVSVMAKNQR